MSEFNGKVELIDQKTICDGFIKVKQLSLKYSLFQGGLSDVLHREVALSTPVVGVLLFDPEEDKVLLVEQFRMGLYVTGEKPWMTEIVAGRVDEGENLEKAVYRESLEETGCHIKKLIPIADYYPSPGACGERMKLYCGFFASADTHGRICGVKEEGENIRTCLLPVAEAFESLNAGKINNATTLIALQWLQENHSSLKGS